MADAMGRQLLERVDAAGGFIRILGGTASYAILSKCSGHACALFVFICALLFVTALFFVQGLGGLKVRVACCTGIS